MLEAYGQGERPVEDPREEWWAWAEGPREGKEETEEAGGGDVSCEAGEARSWGDWAEGGDHGGGEDTGKKEVGGGGRLRWLGVGER